MIDTISTFCPDCDAEVLAAVERRRESLRIKNERVEYDASVAVCPCCHKEIGVYELELDNQNRAYGVYCERHNLVSPNEVGELRARYGLSLREFSRFLGFGEQTVARYEAGSIPDSLHSATLRRAWGVKGAAELLEENGSSISPASVEKVKAFIGRNGFSEGRGQDVPACLDRALRAAPSLLNGLRSLDLERLASAVAYLSERCHALYKTKLQKAMFFSDFLAFEALGASLTGLSYAHATYGPVMSERDETLGFLERSGAIQLVPADDWGEVVRPAREDLDVSGVFSPEELGLLDMVARFVNTFPTAASLSDYSHGLRAWKATGSGVMIDYSLGVGEIGRSIEKRLQQVCSS